jgi:hypothetical protein
VFGGFHDTFRETKYFNDLYVMNFQDFKWTKIEYGPHAQIPAPRSGCQMAVHANGDSVLVYGGYSKLKDTTRNVQGKIHQDAWMISMKQVVSGGAASWEKVGKKGSPPSIRSGEMIHRSMYVCSLLNMLSLLYV